MKTLLLKPSEFRAFTLGVGISVGLLTLSFLITFYGETRDKMRSRSFKPATVVHQQPVYSEIQGMN